MKEIKIHPDYQCSPILMKNAEGFFEPIELNELNIDVSNELIKKIDNWRKEFDNTLNDDTPSKSGFNNKESRLDFENRGLLLWDDLTEIYKGEYSVSYFSVKYYKEFENKELYNQYIG